MAFIDINCDMGENFGIYRPFNDADLLKWISSANIACGFHAGDQAVMQHTVKLALKHQVKIGAHPGLPDLQGFGRREMSISPTECYQLMLYQIGALYAFTRAAGAKLNHVKPHGALYNMAARERSLADAIAQAVYDFDPGLILYGLSGSELIRSAEKKGLNTAAEVFADRRYMDDGSLCPRTSPSALITETAEALEQVRMMVFEQQVRTVSGKTIPIRAETICIHGDSLQSLEIAQKLTEGFS